MAKRSKSLAVRPQVVVMSAPRRRGRIRRAASRAVGFARRGARHAAPAMPTVGIALGGGIVGYLQGSGRLNFLPEVGGSRMVTLGLAGWTATRFIKNRHVRAAGLAALAAAAFDFGRAQGGGASGEDEGWGWEK